MTKAQRQIKRWREDPLSFVIDNFKVAPDWWQRDGLEPCGGAPNPYRRLAFKACTGPGKSAELAWIGWHRLACFGDYGEHPKGAALSGEGWTNLQDNLWAELSKWQQRSEFLKAAFTWTQRRIYANTAPETWFLAARSYPKDANAEAIGTSLSGLHSPYPFILLDETGKMPVTVGQKAEQIFTGGVRDGLIAQAGNPVSKDGLLYASAMSPDTTTITITADPDDPKRTPRVDPAHARKMISKYGRTNPWVMATILGTFPESAINTLLSLDDVEKAMARRYKEDVYERAQKRLGVDVARFGLDSTVIFPRQGLRAFNPVEMKGARSHEVAARVAMAKSKWGSHVEFVDNTGGYGSGVVDSLLQAGHAPVPVEFAGKPQDSKYLNARAEMWWRMAEWVKRGAWLPDVPVLKRELAEPTYTFNAGKFQLEPKEAIVKRLGFSPDYADSLACTFYYPEADAGLADILGNVMAATGGNETEWDPFSEEHAR